MTMDEAIESDHADRLTVSRMNSDNSKLLTASIDHRIAVYDVDPSTGKRTQLDVFGAHDAEIRDAKWFDRTTGTFFVTVANDLQARIWTRDPSQAPMSGRCFRRIATIKCEQLVPFVSVDVKTTGNNTYIATIDRQGLLSLHEPTHSDGYNEWTLVDQLHVVSPPPNRGDHTSFRVVFDQNPFPSPFLQAKSDDRGQLTVAVTALNEVKLYRTTSDPSIITAQTPPEGHAQTVGQDASHRLYFFEVLRIQPAYTQPPTSAGLLLRDVSFRPGNVTGSDVVAISSINGTVAVYEVRLANKSNLAMQNTSPAKQVRPPPQPHQSNLTSALHPTAASSQAAQQVLLRTNHPFPYMHHATPIVILEDAHMDAWSVQWDKFGDILLSSGSEGTVKIWKRTVANDNSESYELVGEQAVEDDSESDDDSSEAVDTNS